MPPGEPLENPVESQVGEQGTMVLKHIIKQRAIKQISSLAISYEIGTAGPSTSILCVTFSGN